MNIKRIDCLKSWIRTGLVARWRKELIMKLDIQNAQEDSQGVNQEGEFDDY